MMLAARRRYLSVTGRWGSEIQKEWRREAQRVGAHEPMLVVIEREAYALRRDREICGTAGEVAYAEDQVNAAAAVCLR